MLPYTKILWPTDFSESSFEALAVAVELARQGSAELIALHVHPLLSVPTDVLAAPVFDPVEYNRRVGEMARGRLDAVTRDRVPAGLRCQALVKAGDAGHEILQTVKELGVDLIVIATHGMTGWRHYLYGSVAQRVVQHPPCSVLVVRAPAVIPPP